MLSLSPAKLLIVGVVAMILLGPDKLPQFARQIGGAWKAFRSFNERMEQEVRSTIPDLPSTTDLARMARSPVTFLNQLADLSPKNLEPPVPDPGADAPPAAEGAWPADPGAAPGGVDQGPAADPLTGAPAAAHGPVDASPSPAPAAPRGAGRPPVTPGPLRVPDDPSMN